MINMFKQARKFKSWLHKDIAESTKKLLGVNIEIGMNLFKQARKFTIITSRFSVIKQYVYDKEVLDLGSVDHDASTESSTSWLHKNIAENAKTLLGVDIEKEQVLKLQEKGYNIICGDVETLELNKQFDVIVAGELIEHSSNQGLFLETCRKHLRDDGVLIISTPNAVGIIGFAAVLLLGGRPGNNDHVLFHSFLTLKQLLNKHGFEIVEGYYVLHREHGLRFVLDRIATLVRRDFASTLLCIARKKKSSNSTI